MAGPDLLQAFQRLVMPMPAATGHELAAVPIPGAEQHRLAKDAAGSPCVLIRQRAQTSRPAPIKLENLSVSFDISCRVRHAAGGLEEDTFTIVRCSTHNPALHPHFLRIVSPLIEALGATPTSAAVRRAIYGLVELFQALSSPGTKTIQGIWAELLLIRVARDPVAMSIAWHREPREHFDFADGPQRIEVKSSNTRRREHNFSLEQLTPVGGSHILIASAFVERSGGGVSLETQFNEARALLSPDAALLSRFDAVFYASLGSGWSDAMDESFDWELAADSIAFYAAEAIPRPQNATPQAVFDVRFRADLASTAALNQQQVAELGGLFRSAVPSRFR